MKRMTLQGLSVGHRGRAVLRGIDLVIEEGESCFLAGPNGAGKTTLIRTICGILKPVSGFTEHTFNRIAYVPQVRILDRQFPLTVREAASLGLSSDTVQGRLLRFFAMGRSNLQPNRQNIETYLELVGLGLKADRLIRECSGGELQRMLIARALIREPDLVALDEPMSFLDESGRRDILGLLTALNRTKGLTVILSGHDRGLSEEFRTMIRIDGETVLKSRSKKR
jgi:ABC-type Mn2+/Zn2+ transport system ATPase subunit